MGLRSNLTFALLGVRQGSNSVRCYGPESVHRFLVLGLGQDLHQEFALVHHGDLGGTTSYQYATLISMFSNFFGSVSSVIVVVRLAESATKKETMEELCSSALLACDHWTVMIVM